jgi:hypothetical protein
MVLVDDQVDGGRGTKSCDGCGSCNRVIGNMVSSFLLQLC